MTTWFRALLIITLAIVGIAPLRAQAQGGAELVAPEAEPTANAEPEPEPEPMLMAAPEPMLVAEVPPAPPPARPKSEIALELAMHAGSITGGSIFSFSPVLRASIQVHDHVAIEAAWALPFASISPDVGDSASALRIGNPWIAGYYTGAFGKFKLRVGAGLGIPIASLPTVDITDPSSVQAAGAARAAFAEGGGVRGVWVPWLWAVDYLSIGVPATVTWTAAENVNLVGDIGFVYLVYTGDDTAKSNRTFMRFGVAGSYTAGIVQAGLRLQAIWFPSDDGDNAQLAIEPYVRINFGLPFVRLGFLMNLDEPRGFAFGENHTWGLRLEGGVSF